MMQSLVCVSLLHGTSKKWRNSAPANIKKLKLMWCQRGMSLINISFGRRSLTATLYSLLAHAGFDPRHALRFWEERSETEQTAECTPSKAKAKAAHTYQMRWMGSAHPLNEVRVTKLREEFERWEKERQKARKQLATQRSS